MSFAVFVGDPTIVRESTEYQDWLDSTPDSGGPLQCFTPEDVPVSTGSLFSPAPPIEVIADTVKVHTIRELLYRAEDTGESIAIITGSKPRGNVEKDGVEVVSIPTPTGNALVDYISSEYNIPVKTAQFIVKRHGSSNKNSKPSEEIKAFLSCSAIASQLSFIPRGTKRTNRHYSSTYDPFRGDMPPWNLTDAINNGDAHGAYTQVMLLLNQKKTTPQSLFMQLCGYYRKVISPDTDWFQSISRSLVDKPTAISLMSEYSFSVMESDKISSSYHVMSFVTRLSTCFR